MTNDLEVYLCEALIKAVADGAYKLAQNGYTEEAALQKICPLYKDYLTQIDFSNDESFKAITNAYMIERF